MDRQRQLYDTGLYTSQHNIGYVLTRAALISRDQSEFGIVRGRLRVSAGLTKDELTERPGLTSEQQMLASLRELMAATFDSAPSVGCWRVDERQAASCAYSPR